MQGSLLALVGSMGAFAWGVVCVLFIMSIWCLWVAIDKYFRFKKARNQSMAFAEILGKQLEQKNLQQAYTLTRDKRYKESHVGKIVNAGLQEFLRIIEVGSASVDNPKDETMEQAKVLERTQHAMERAQILIITDFKKGLSILATVGATGPFVGLLGTVVGILNAFGKMKTMGAGGIGEVSGGIAEALVTTAFGLLVAIPAVWLYNYFTGRVERIQHEMGNVTADMLDYLVDVNVQELRHAKNS
jgi:biopolymer transport protein ExbB